MVICDITIKSKKWQKQKNISEFIENITTKIIGLCELKKFNKFIVDVVLTL